jgi:hypothetical protein
LQTVRRRPYTEDPIGAEVHRVIFEPGNSKVIGFDA